MGKIGKISSIKKEYSKEFQTMESSLANAGFSRTPGTGVRFVPFKENTNGEYRTGLNPDALYIKRMTNPEERKIEVARVTAELERIKSILGEDFDLGPKSPFYTEMLGPRHGEDTVARTVKLMESNIFRLDDPYEAITYAWLRVHPEIAPSYNSWKTGKVPPDTMFFVDDQEWEAEQNYKDNVTINNAISSLDSLTPSKRLKIAKLLGLKVGLNTKEAIVYNELTNFIKDTNHRQGKLHNVLLFKSMINLSDETVQIKYLVEEALELNIYRIKNGRIYQGEMEVAKDKETLIGNLSSTKYQEDFLALEELVKQKTIVEQI